MARCADHFKMVHKKEFQWVLGILVGVFLAIIGVTWSVKADTSNVKDMEKRLNRMDALRYEERREMRAEFLMINQKLDEIKGGH